MQARGLITARFQQLRLGALAPPYAWTPPRTTIFSLDRLSSELPLVQRFFLSADDELW
jgi:hypothetical protein